jgi:hypothetical protein
MGERELCKRKDRIRVAIAEVSVGTGTCDVEATKWPWQVRPDDIAFDWTATLDATLHRHDIGRHSPVQFMQWPSRFNVR